MGSSDPELIVDPSRQSVYLEGKTVLFLSFLFLQTDSPFELGIMDDFCSGLKQFSHQVLQNSALKYHE